MGDPWATLFFVEVATIPHNVGDTFLCRSGGREELFVFKNEDKKDIYTATLTSKEVIAVYDMVAKKTIGKSSLGHYLVLNNVLHIRRCRAVDGEVVSVKSVMLLENRTVAAWTPTLNERMTRLVDDDNNVPIYVTVDHENKMLLFLPQEATATDLRRQLQIGVGQGGDDSTFPAVAEPIKQKLRTAKVDASTVVIQVGKEGVTYISLEDDCRLFPNTWSGEHKCFLVNINLEMGDVIVLMSSNWSTLTQPETTVISGAGITAAPISVESAATAQAEAKAIVQVVNTRLTSMRQNAKQVIEFQKLIEGIEMREAELRIYDYYSQLPPRVASSCRSTAIDPPETELDRQILTESAFHSTRVASSCRSTAIDTPETELDRQILTESAFHSTS
jgi:hypothetical protein